MNQTINLSNINFLQNKTIPLGDKEFYNCHFDTEQLGIFFRNEFAQRIAIYLIVFFLIYLVYKIVFYNHTKETSFPKWYYISEMILLILFKGIFFFSLVTYFFDMRGLFNFIIYGVSYLIIVMTFFGVLSYLSSKVIPK